MTGWSSSHADGADGVLAAHPRRVAAREPLFAPRRRRSNRRTGRRREHRRRIPRRRDSMATTTCAESNDICWLRWTAAPRPSSCSTKPTWSSDPAANVAEVRALSPGIAVHAVSCNDPDSLDVLRAYLGPGPDRGAARIVRRGQVDDRQSARRLRPAAPRATSACRTAGDGTRAPAGSW